MGWCSTGHSSAVFLSLAASRAFDGNLLLYIEALQAKLLPKVLRHLPAPCASDRHDLVIEPLKGDALLLKNFRKTIDCLQRFSPEKSGAFPLENFLKDSPYMDWGPGGPVTDALGWVAGQTGGRLAAGFDETIFGRQSATNPDTKFSAADMQQIVSMTTEIKRLNASGKVEKFREWRVGRPSEEGVPGMSPEDQQIWADARNQAMLIHEDKLGAANPEGQQNLAGMKNIRTTYDLFETMQELNEVLIKKGMKKGARLDLDVGAEEWKGAFGGDAVAAEKAITAARTLLMKSMDEWRAGMLSTLSNWSGVKKLLGRETGFSGPDVQTNILPVWVLILFSQSQALIWLALELAKYLA